MAGPEHAPSLRLALLAWLLAALATVAGVLAGGLALAAGDPVSWKPLALPALWSLPGALIAAGRPRMAVGWLMLSVALLFAVSGLAESWVRYGDPAARATAVWFVDRASAVLVVCTFLTLLLLPDGRLPSRRWRPVVVATVTGQLLLIGAWSLVRGPAAAPDSSWPARVADLANPVGVLPASWGGPVAGLDWLLQVSLLLSLPVLFLRLRRGPVEERNRLVVVLLALAVFVTVVVVGRAAWPPAADLLDVAASLFLAAVLVSAVLRRRLQDVTVVVHHTFVYATLVLGIALLYLAVAGLIVAAGPDLPPFGTGVVAAGAALAVLPLRTRLQRAVDRLLHGDRRDPYSALSRLAEHAHRAPTLDELLPAVAASVTASLRVGWVRVEAFGHAAEHGRPHTGGPVVRTPLLAGDAEVGTISVAPHAGRRLRDDERRLLAELGRHAGIAADAVRLATQVAEHHRQVVAAREEERRRLGRELHDELGPVVAGLSMQLGALRPLVRSDPATVVDRLARLEEAASGALEGIRRVAHELRPPVLDQVGLDAAVRQLADSLGLVLVEERLAHGPLPAAVELAAYRIIAEALANAARHSGSSHVRISAQEGDDLLLVTVTDDGAGIDPAAAPGLGLAGMAERAEEVGGTVAVRPAEHGGTTVSAILPLSAQTAADVRTEP
ncbi:histidine kinase [Nocardioides pakistanensis]